MKEVLAKAESKMGKTIARLESDYAAIRAGRANPAVLDKVMVDYYGAPTPVNQLAAVSVAEARVLTIQPWDGSVCRAIERAIQTSDIGINPQSDGKTIRLIFPPLTEEKRKDIVKDVSHMAEEAKIPYLLNTMVTNISLRSDGRKKVTAMNKEDGLLEIETETVILAMGCRERSRGALNIPGSRPAGIYSAGTAQYYVNIRGRMPGKNVVILGSGDIGLIMARRMVLEGAKVQCVAELRPQSGGLKRNIVQCLDDFNIPLYLNTTVAQIHGRDRVEGVTLTKVDDNGKTIPGSEWEVPCDTLLLSCGLIPENELTRGLGADMDGKTGGPVVGENLECSITGVFACGNVLHVHDLADNVTTESERAGTAAAAYALGTDAGTVPNCELTVSPAGIAGYALPGRITAAALTKLNFRVRRPVDAARVRILADGKELFAGKVRAFKPSVMESFPLPAKVIQRALDLGASEIVLSVDPVEEA